MAQSPLILDNPIHDTVVVLKAGPTGGVVNVFSKPIGQLNENAVTKTIIDTSLSESGKLPEPESFDVHYIQAIYLGTPEADIIQMEQNTFCVFQNAGLQIKALQVTKTLITAGTGFPYTSNPGNNGSPANWGYPAQTCVFKLDHPILLGINEQFNMLWQFGTISLTANATVRWVLRGPHFMVDVLALMNPNLPENAQLPGGGLNKLISTRKSR